MRNENESPNYYSVLPASVRYDSRLSANAKLLYSEITALSNKTGKCWASNNYFADLYNVDRRSIINWVGLLKEYGYINVQLVYEQGKKEVKERIITLTEVVKIPSRGGEKNFTTSGKNLHEVVKKISLGSEKNFVDNTKHNTQTETINLNTENLETVENNPSKDLKEIKEVKPNINEMVNQLSEENITHFNTLSFQQKINFLDQLNIGYEDQLEMISILKTKGKKQNQSPIEFEGEEEIIIESPTIFEDNCKVTASDLGIDY